MEFIAKHWKAIGAVLGSIGGLLVSYGIMTPEQVEALMAIADKLLIVVFGAGAGAYVINRNKYPDEQEKAAKPEYLECHPLAVVAAVVFVVILSGCQASQSGKEVQALYSGCDTPLQCAYAAYGIYVASSEVAANKLSDPRLPFSAKDRIYKARQNAKGPAREALAFTVEIERTRAEIRDLQQTAPENADAIDMRISELQALVNNLEPISKRAYALAEELRNVTN